MHDICICIIHSYPTASTREWNALPDNIKQSETVTSFKYALYKNVENCNKSFYYGYRNCNVIHPRLWIEHSSLR